MGTDNQNSQETATEEPITFTQEEVNKFLAKDRKQMAERYADYDSLKEKAAKFDEMEEANKSELQKANEKAEDLQKRLDALTKANEVRDLRAKVAKEYGVPESLLTAENEDSCIEQAKALVEYAKPTSYPQIKDSGTVPIGGGSTREKFANWFAENSNIH